MKEKFTQIGWTKLKLTFMTIHDIELCSEASHDDCLVKGKCHLKNLALVDDDDVKECKKILVVKSAEEMES